VAAPLESQPHEAGSATNAATIRTVAPRPSRIVRNRFVIETSLRGESRSWDRISLTRRGGTAVQRPLDAAAASAAPQHPIGDRDREADGALTVDNATPRRQRMGARSVIRVRIFCASEQVGGFTDLVRPRTGGKQTIEQRGWRSITRQSLTSAQGDRVRPQVWTTGCSPRCLGD
jgi:hypothetical protein